MGIGPSAPEAPDGRIHLAVRPRLSSGPATCSATEIGKFLVSEGFLYFPGEGAMPKEWPVLFPRRIHLPEELHNDSSKPTALTLCVGLPLLALHQKIKALITRIPFQPSGGPVGWIHLTCLSSAFLRFPMLDEPT